MLVLGVHALLLSLLATSTVSPWRRVSGPAPRLTVVQLEALPPPPTKKVDREPARADVPPTAPRERPQPAATAPTAPTALARPAFASPARSPAVEQAAPAPSSELPALPVASASSAPGTAALGRAASAPAAPAPALRLDLPSIRRGDTAASPAQQAVERQAGGQPRLNAEARLARRLETTWTEENLGDGRIRLRRGEDCVILKETTASQLDPWNNRGPAPRGASPCP